MAPHEAIIFEHLTDRKVASVSLKRQYDKTFLNKLGRLSV
jgi:hypothetical protein